MKNKTDRAYNIESIAKLSAEESKLKESSSRTYVPHGG